METNAAQADYALKRTRAAFMWMKLLDTPFWAIFNMLPFILFRDLHATPLQITAIIILKPAVSLVSIYWSSLIERRKDRLLSNLIWARVLSHAPFLLFPFVENVWYFILSFGFFMMLSRGTVPAWMEVLKLNMNDESRDRTFAYGSTVAYLGGALVPFILGGLMDTYEQSWRWIFVATTLLSMGAVFFKSRIPIEMNAVDHDNKDNAVTPSFKEQLVKPWKSAWELILRRPDFGRYQIGYLIGGAGLIIMQPALPIYMMDKLNISYTELAVALTLCKGIGVAITSPAWAKLIARIDIFNFNAWVSLIAAVFPLFLIATQMNIAWLFVGYFIYGAMQGGSEMSWNLSGPIFAKNEDSSVYSSVNVLSVGLRGCVIPALGSLMMYQMDTTSIMVIGSFISLISAYYMRRNSQQIELYARQ